MILFFVASCVAGLGCFLEWRSSRVAEERSLDAQLADIAFWKEAGKHAATLRPGDLDRPSYLRRRYPELSRLQHELWRKRELAKEGPRKQLRLRKVARVAMSVGLIFGVISAAVS